jgi:glutamyl-tRNA reductase
VLATAAAGDLRQRRVLVIGLGEIGQLTLRLLHARGVRQLLVVNRNVEKAEAEATRWQAQVYPLSELAEALAAADVVISATSAPQPLISTTMLRRVMAARGQQPLVLVDLAVPRDIEPAVASLPNVQYFDVDDLHAEQDATRHSRQQELPHAEAIINAELTTWQRNLQELAVKPLIVNLRQQAEAIRQQEVARTLRFLGEADAATLAQIEQLSRALVNQLLHQPTLRLKASAANNEAAPYIAAIQELFGLETKT